MPGRETRDAGTLRGVVSEATAIGARRLGLRLVEGFREHDLLIEAGAIAFRSLLALVTGALCVVGLGGFFDLSEIWTRDLAPDLRGGVSPPAYRLIDGAVTYVLEDGQLAWATAGAALAVWQISSVVRAAGQLLNRIYGADDSRSLKNELLTSLAAGAAVGVLLLAAVAAVHLGPLALADLLGEGGALSVLSFVVRWTVAIVLLLAAVGIVVRVAPAVERPARWVTFGSVLVTLGWGATSVVFGLYLTHFAGFENVFGALTALFLFAEYLFLLAVIFLACLLVDALLRDGTG